MKTIMTNLYKDKIAVEFQIIKDILFHHLVQVSSKRSLSFPARIFPPRGNYFPQQYECLYKKVVSLHGNVNLLQ